MKTLMVLRHAKSSWDHPDLGDFDRPLNSRGRKNAPLVGREMRARGYHPEIVVASPAARAKATAELVLDASGFDADLSFEPRIYEASLSSLLYLVSGFDDVYQSILIVGHNPGFEGLVAALSGEYRRMATAALAVIDLEVEYWNDADQGCGVLRDHILPRSLDV